VLTFAIMLGIILSLQGLCFDMVEARAKNRR